MRNRSFRMIKLMKSTFFCEEETKKRLCDFLMKAEKLSMGDKCREFEKQFAKYQNRKYAVLFNSGSSANLALIQALLNLNLLKEKDKVGFSAITWATNVMPLIQLGLEPVPADVELSTLNVSSKEFEKIMISNKLKAFFITNLLGFCSDIDRIKNLCKKNNVILIEDNCESLGSEYKGKKLGNFGLASTFSFYVAHQISTVEGGMVCTDNKEVFDMLLMVRAHGWDRDLDEKSKKEIRSKHKVGDFQAQYYFYYPGYNMRATEITGFLGIEQLKHFDLMNRKRQENFKMFNKAANSNKDLKKLNLDHMDFISNFSYPVISESFEYYKKKFQKAGVEIRPVVAGSILEQPFFKDYLKREGKHFECPNAKRIHEKGFYFPNNAELTDREIKILCDLIKSR